jgi:V8-like Glu-specific endopeptidase
MPSTFERARSYVGEGFIQDALTTIESLLSGQNIGNKPGSRLRGLRQELLVHKASERKLSDDRRRGIFSPAEISVRESQLNSRVLEFIDEAEKLLEGVEAPQPVWAPGAGVPASERSIFEKIWGRDTLQSLFWLHKGLEASRAICRVVLPNSIGTGFVVREGQVLTNWHLVRNAQEASKVSFEFNYEEGPDRRLRDITRYGADASPDAFFSNESLDCAVLKIKADANKAPIVSWGELDLSESVEGTEVGAPVTIIGHPEGGQKKIALTLNEVVNKYEHRLQYMTATLPGSSGSPVFNESWQVVAIHHAGGNLIKNEKGDRFFANEGILMSSILAMPEFRKRIG